MTIGDGHDLKSPRFSGDEVLEACYDNERFLRKGDNGPAVQKIQQALIDSGFSLPRFGADGIFGDETKSAVKNYQQARGLMPDGIVGPITIGKLDLEFLPTPVIPVPPVPAPPVTPITPITPSLPTDSQGRKFHSSGIWNGKTSLTVPGGQGMHFEVKNLNALGSTIRIIANTGESKGSILLPQIPVDFEFSIFGNEPFGWRFEIETDSDAFLVQWKLYSTWVPGDPNNP